MQPARRSGDVSALALCCWQCGPPVQPLEIKTPGGPGTAWFAALIASRWSQPLAVCFQPAPAAACMQARACVHGPVCPWGQTLSVLQLLCGVLLQLDSGRVLGGWELRGCPRDGFAGSLAGGRRLVLVVLWRRGARTGVPRQSTVLCSLRGGLQPGCYQGPDFGIPQSTPCGVSFIHSSAAPSAASQPQLGPQPTCQQPSCRQLSVPLRLQTPGLQSAYMVWYGSHQASCM